MNAPGKSAVIRPACLFVCTAMVSLAFTATAIAAAPPQACGGTQQITDVVGDGHHNTTDVTAAWFAEAPGSLQAVIRVNAGNWAPDHDDSDVAGFALIYTVDGSVRFVRTITGRGTAPAYDYGSWSIEGGFVSQGSTTGAIQAGPGGATTIDMPALPTGTPVTKPFVLTYDGIEAGVPHWVDRAPGGVTPADGGFGADFIVGTCVPGALGDRIVATQLSARSSITGAKGVLVSGRVLPATDGIKVKVSVRAKKPVSLTATTAADGTFSVRAPLVETSRITATAGGIVSQELTVTVKSKVTLKLRKRGKRATFSGRTNPALPGVVLLLREGEYRSTARVKPRRGRFTFRLNSPRAGAYRAVFIPQKGRAERSTSNKGTIR